MHNDSLRLIVGLLIGLSISGCREPGPNSSLRTLDNIATARPQFEACTGSGDVHRKVDPTIPSHLRLALAAVPIQIQNAFFDDLGGKIRVVDDPSLKDCGPLGARTDDRLSCWRRLPNQTSSIEIIVKKSNATIEQYALVRTFGFVYGDILIHRVMPASLNAPVLISERPQGHLKDYKAHLASVFLGDLIATASGQQEKEAIETLAELGIPKSVASEPNFEKRWLEFSRLPVSTQDSFSSRVFAEAFHSQFCSEKSAERACKLFGQTMRAFAPFAEDVTSKSWMQKHATCAVNSTSLAAPTASASSSRKEWFASHRGTINERQNRGLENGTLVNAKIAEYALSATNQARQGTQTSAFNLSGDLLSMLQNLLSGGLSLGGGGGGLGGVLNQILGGIGGGGGGLGGLSGLLSNLGLGGPMGNNLGGGAGGGEPINNTPPQTTPIDAGGNNAPGPSGGSGSGIASAEEKAGMDATNRYRQSQGKEPLQIDDQMIADCRKQAQAQVAQGLQHWLVPAGIARGENIAYGSKSGEYTVMQQWVKSPGHHANIMGNYRYIGIGNVGNQWCQRFR